MDVHDEKFLINNRASRDHILARVRAGLRHDPAQAATKRQAALNMMAQHVQGPRPTLNGSLSDSLMQRFCRRSVAMSSSVDHVAQLDEIPAAIARYLVAGKLPMQAVCWAALGGLDWASVGLSVEARAARADDLVGITGTFCAMAETGTLMLLSSPHSAASTSLLPETHIAIVQAACIVAGMEDGFTRLRAEHGTLPRAVNFVSGPSRTGDIEQTIVLGAHGPYRVHLVMVGA